jgi:hypothetical protein
VLVHEEGEDASMQCRRKSKMDQCRKAKGEEVVEEDRCLLRSCLSHRTAGVGVDQQEGGHIKESLQLAAWY